MSSPERFDNVSLVCKANIYFEGKVVSHTALFADGSKKTVGLIYPGEFRFNTGASERMEIVAGNCRVRQKDSEKWENYAAGSFFDVPANSLFDIEVKEGICEYVCSFGV